MNTADPDDGESSIDMNVLASRINDIVNAPKPSPCRLLELDAMVPGQRLALSEAPEALVNLFKQEDRVVMAGRAPPLRPPLSHGVECRMEDLVEEPGAPPSMTLVAGDFVEISDIGPQGDSRWLGRAASAVAVPLGAEAPEEQPTDAMIERSKALEELVDEWMALVRNGRERQPGQLDGVLADMGPMPPADLPSKRALWVAGLINPLPALGVALEIRPACLTAETADLRLQVAEMGIQDSIERLKLPGPAF